MAETCCQFGSDSGINPRPCNWPAAPGGVLPVFNECYSRRDGHRFQRGRDSVVNQPVITLSLSSLATFFLFFSFYFISIFFFPFFSNSLYRGRRGRTNPPSVRNTEEFFLAHCAPVEVEMILINFFFGLNYFFS